MGKPDLKPCPFCGSDNIHAGSSYRPINITTASIQCYGCGIGINATSYWTEGDRFTEEELLEKLSAMWNRRAGENGESNAEA